MHANLRELWRLKYKSCHNDAEIRSPGCEYQEELNNSHDNFFLQRLTTKILKPRHHSSQAAGDRLRQLVEIRQSDFKLRQSQKKNQLVSVNEFGNRSQRASTKRDCEFVHLTHFTNWDLEVVLRLTKHDGTVFFLQACQVLSKLRGTKKSRLTHSIYIRLVDTVMVPHSTSSVKDTVELERTHIPHGQLFQLEINL